jgi:catechol 2,3-dioxygenase-like lactoylglutathione lyase family enzyme
LTVIVLLLRATFRVFTIQALPGLIKWCWEVAAGECLLISGKGCAAMNLTQIRIMAEDFHKSMAFYRDVLELPVVVHVAEMDYVSFKAGNVQLEILPKRVMAEVLGETDLPADASRQSGFLLDCAVDNVDEAYARLRHKGVKFVNEPHDRPAWNARVCHLRDPDGNVIELYKHPL